MALARNTVLPKEPRKRRTFSKNRSKIEPRGLQNRALGPPKSSPERSKTRFLKTSNLKSFRGGGPLYQATTFEPNLAPSWRPQKLQKRGRNPKISTLKNDAFLTSILKGVRLRFGRVFGRFFQRKFVEKCKNALLAKTLKIVIFPREN